MKNVIKPLAKSVSIPLGLSAAAAAADVGIQKKKSQDLVTGNTTLILSVDEMEDIIKEVESLEDSSLLLKGVSETIQNEAKK